MTKRARHTYKAILLATVISAFSAELAHTNNFGLEVVGDAVVTYTSNGSRIIQPTNEVKFTVRPPRVTPKIEFFRHSPMADSALVVKMNGSRYSPSGDLEGPFSAINIPSGAAQSIDLSQPVPVSPAKVFMSGEVMFLRVDHITANINSSIIDTTVVVVESEVGDLMTIELYESGPDTGEFWAYMPSTKLNPVINDDNLSTGPNSNITAQISIDNTQTQFVVDTVFVNPINTVFNSVTGEPVNGASIELINLSNNDLANVWGVDRFSAFPSTLMSGEKIEDASGLSYDNEDGVFSFPYLEPGNYAVKVTPPAGFSFASILSPEIINSYVGNGRVIVDASYGKSYVLESAGPLRFDIPLDPLSNINLTKTADTESADIGDFVGYTVAIENTGSKAVPVNLHDTLPLGFRYVPGTALVSETAVPDPTVSPNGTELTFALGLVQPNTTLSLNYALEVGPAGFANGDAVNQAVILDGAKSPISNIARASVRYREDLFRTHSTIVGRITENACNSDELWAREIKAGDGVEGVRLYMETGAYAISDAAGLYHFEGVEEGTHVVQVDKDTLPAGFEIMTCEENTRYAGNASSMFVDVQGGNIWRANFYLRRTGEVLSDIETTAAFNDATAYQAFDQSWLDIQNSNAEWVYPETGSTPSKPSVNIGIKHPENTTVQLFLNGRAVPSFNFAARDRSSSGGVALTRWRGVDILLGENEFTATIRGANNAIIKTIHNDVSYVESVARAHGVAGRSSLVADGRSIPNLAIRLEDEAGRPVHAGRVAKIQLEAPYSLFDETAKKDVESRSSDLISPLGSQPDFYVGPDGIVDVKLQPTLATGKVTVNVTLDNGRVVPVHMYLEPEKRDWVIVGLAEGSIGYETILDKAQSITETKEDVFNDGRVAFFAKGLIKGNWLLTAALDTDKRRGGKDGDFANEIDPNAYYTLYGDRTYQDLETKSRYPIYLKLEKRNAYALFGDYATNMTESKLSAYNRQLSGIKGEYIGESYEALGFGAETNQGFAKEELAADGTSGTYQLSHRNILAQSETIVIETRDRDRSDVILERRQLTRFADYTLDYFTGELIFTFPVAISDVDFNPNVIVVDYETSEEAERNLTFGGRLRAKLLRGLVRLGASFVSENGSSLKAGSKKTLAGVDAVVQVRDDTELRLEYARSESNAPGEKPREAMLAEVYHTSKNVNAEAYFREEDNGFGLGQTNSSTNRLRRYGAKANVKVNGFEDKKTGRRGSQSVEFGAYHEDNLDTGDSRDTADIKLSHQADRITVTAGLRGSNEKFVARENRESILATAQASLSLPNQGAVFTVSREQPLLRGSGTSSHPERTAFTVDKTLGKKITLNLRHEILKQAMNVAQNTIVGLSLSPWKGVVWTAAADRVTSDSGKRLGATLGVDQQVRLSPKWSGSFGLRNRRMLDSGSAYLQVAPDAAISPLEKNEDFTSGYVGVGYRSDVMAASTRLEARTGSDNSTFIGSASIARELTQELSIAGAARAATQDRSSAAGRTQQIDARLGVAWRPRNNGVIIFNRFDFGSQMDEFGKTRVKFVNNIAANAYVTDRLQVTVNHGIKHVTDDRGPVQMSSVSNLFGLETRYDVNEKIDVGFRGSVLVNDKGETAYGYGPSVGFTPAKNVWMSAGYNVKGFADDDFEAAEYSRKGVYLQMRIKFDQDTASGLLERISPSM